MSELDATGGRGWKSAIIPANWGQWTPQETQLTTHMSELDATGGRGWKSAIIPANWGQWTPQETQLTTHMSELDDTGERGWKSAIIPANWGQWTKQETQLTTHMSELDDTGERGWKSAIITANWGQWTPQAVWQSHQPQNTSLTYLRFVEVNGVSQRACQGSPITALSETMLLRKKKTHCLEKILGKHLKKNVLQKLAQDAGPVHPATHHGASAAYSVMPQHEP